MEGKNSKGSDSPYKSNADCNVESNRNFSRGLIYRELGHKQRLGAISREFQAAAEDNLIGKPLEELRCELPGPSRSTFLMVFSPDGTKVASTHGNHNVYVTDLTTGKNVNTLSGHPRTPWCIAFHPSSNQILASGCLGGQVRVWDLHGGSEMWMADGQTVIASLAFHPTDRMLVIATYNELHFWDWSQPEPFTKCYTNNEKEKVRYVAFDPLGHKLITGISNAPQIQSQWDQWDRVSSNNQVPGSSSSSQLRSSLMYPDRERRITVCYRSLVEQYEQLVQRYFDLSRSRSISTMDRGTDPMDFESEDTSNNRSRDSPGPSSSSGNASVVGNAGSRNGQRKDNGTTNTTNTTDTAESSGSSGSPRSGSNNNSYLQALFRQPFRRLLEQSVSRTDSATTTDVEPAIPANSGNTTTSTTATTSTAGWERHRSESSRWVLPPFHHVNSCRVAADRSLSGSTPESVRRRLSTSALLEGSLSRVPASPNREFRLVRDEGPMRPLHIPQSINPTQELLSERQSNRDRPTSPILLPARPRRFYVSQSSAFQPRVPRSSDHRPVEHSPEPRNSGRSVLPRRTTQRISLNAATAAAVAAMPERRTPDPDPPRSRSPLTPLSSGRSRSDMTDVGVRYGIQLLSRHIDNMQRLCRARLEILQLQQIRRMWEDLQHQIRSLHSAVRESSVTLARLTTNPPSGSINDQTNPSQDSSNNVPSQRTEDGQDGAEGSNDSNSGHVPSVSEMLELARISDNIPGSSEGSSQTSNSLGAAVNDSALQSHAGSTSEDANNQPYSFRCQMLQQRLWRISRKVYLRRPRLMTVNSRSMRRQLSSGHSPLSRGSSGLSRHGDLPRRPWFLHSVARHRSAPKPTNNASSQADPPGGQDCKNDSGLPSSSHQAENSRNVDDSQPGPSGLGSRASDALNIKKAWSMEKLDIPVLNEDDDDDDEDEDEDDEDEEELNISVPTRREETKRDNEQQCTLPPSKMRKIDTSEESNPQPSTSRCEPSSSTSEEASAIRSKLLEEIDRLFPKSPRTSSPGPSSSSSGPSTSDNTGASTSQGGGPQDRPNQQEPSACKSLWSMIARLERLVQQQREQRERLRNVLNSQGQERRSNTWGLRDRNLQRVENSGSDSDSNTESERPRNWGRMSAEERLSNALQTEIYERDRMCRAAAGGAHSNTSGQQEEEWEWTRESTRLRARQVLSLMVESLTQFFEENGLSSNTPHEVLDEQIFNLHVLLQLALELTDLLLAQLVCTRRELEHQWVHRLRSPIALSADDPHARDGERDREREGSGRPREVGSLRLPPYRRFYRHRLALDSDGNNCSERLPFRSGRSQYSRRSELRMVNCLNRQYIRNNRVPPHSAHHSNMRPGRNSYSRPVARPAVTRPSAPAHHPSHFVQSSRPPQQVEADSSSNVLSSGNTDGEERPPPTSNEDVPSSSNIPVTQSHDAFTVPLVRVNDVLIPDTSVLNQPRTRPQSPPLLHPNSPFGNPFAQVGSSEQRSRNSLWDYWPYVPGNSWRPRFLHPRYMGSNIFNDDSEEPSPSPDFSYFRVPETVIITDAPMTPNHRIQVWDFSNFHIPDISNAEKNIIVPECKIHNDASVDVSKDGRLLVTLLPSGRQSITTMLGVYSLQWESLGQCLYTTSFLQSAVSVSLSPASRYLLVGLASRRVALLPNDRHFMAQVLRLDGGKPGRTGGRRGRLCPMRDIEQSRDQGFMSLNCIRWAPGSGQGFVYGTNTGQLRVLR